VLSSWTGGDCENGNVEAEPETIYHSYARAEYRYTKIIKRRLMNGEEGVPLMKI